MMKPFLKWVGGKRGLIEQMKPHLPERFGCYHEPFVGGGALFFHLQPRRAKMADRNSRLVRTFRAVRDDVERVIELLKSFPHDEGFFRDLRSRKTVDDWPDAEVASWFIYLNKTGYNGLYRVNKGGRFNVPFGRYADPKICDEETLRACARALAGSEIQAGDFEGAVQRAKKGDLVYFDPPYAPLEDSRSFTAYTKGGFGADDHQRLRDVALALRARGVHVLLSNSDTPFVRELYGDDFELVEVQARRSVNSRGAGRGRVGELLIK